MSTSTQCVRTWAAAAFATALAGCAVGPQYVRPQAPAIVLASPQAAEFAAADAEAEAEAEAAPVAWWQVFDDEGLSRWIEAALARNHDIRQAQANLLAARAIFDERRLDRLPGVTSGADYTRGIQQQASNGGQRTLSESWQAGFDVQWEVDLFGRLDRLQRAAMARAEASQAELEMTRLSIAAEVARTWFEAQGYRRRLEVTRQEADNWRETVRLAQASLHAGAGLPEEVENAQANLLRSEAELPALAAALQQARHRLDVLAGQRPGQGGLPEPDAVRAAPLVARVPLGDVNRMILARPDVMQAERLLAAGVEDVGAATADLYPRIDLGGFLGFFALRDGDFGSAASHAFQIVPTVSWPALRLGNARARLRGAEALSDGAMARYEQVLLTAQQEVESAVTQVVEQQRQLAGLLQAAQHAQAAFDISDRRYRAGAGSYQAVLENQRTLFQLRRQIAQQEVDSQIHIVALYKALGWNVPSPKDAESLSSSAGRQAARHRSGA